ncbi:MAG TPA: preprotein translocase subunit YajC [Croceibacterium sp.]|jgi:preprotein translocase subunit YajC
MLDFLTAAAGSASSGPGWIAFVPYIGIFAIIYFLMIRPQMRQQKDHRSKIASVKKGDQVVTGGGIVGKVVKVDDNYADVEVAQGVRLKVVKSTIGDIIPPGGTPAND